jgi:heme-binding NEAT domain protein
MNQKPAVEGNPDVNAPETEPQTTLEPSPTDETTETQELVESLRKMLIGGHIRDYSSWRHVTRS